MEVALDQNEALLYARNFHHKDSLNLYRSPIDARVDPVKGPLKEPQTQKPRIPGGLSIPPTSYTRRVAG